MTEAPGHLMKTEAQEARGAVMRAARQQVPALPPPNSLYTVARGSSDAAANVLCYEFMRVLCIPSTSLPPSVFSLGPGVALRKAVVMVISQSGASDDLVRSAEGAKKAGAQVLALTNTAGSAIEAVADVTLPVAAGPERAVPATKSVTGSIGAGLAWLASMEPAYRPTLDHSLRALEQAHEALPGAVELAAALRRARHVYVIGRDASYGAAIEVALKLKECCALHAEAHSSSEVLHGPLQLATNPLTVLILDTGAAQTKASLDAAEARFRNEGCDVHRVSPADLGVEIASPAVAASLLLCAVYPVILEAALGLGLNPDAPQTLSKVTRTL